jgi:hypothetical protein
MYALPWPFAPLAPEDDLHCPRCGEPWPPEDPEIPNLVYCQGCGFPKSYNV